MVMVREPNGRLSRSTEHAIDAVAPAVVKRLRDAAARGMADQEWGTQLGRLFLEAKITAPQYEAGKRWGRLVTLWHKSVGAPKPYPGEGPVAFLGTTRGKDGSEDPAIDTAEGKKLRRTRYDAIDDMQQAHAVLLGAGMLAESAVRGTCEANEAPIGSLGMENLQRGLSWLARHWGLTKN